MEDKIQELDFEGWRAVCHQTLWRGQEEEPGKRAQMAQVSQPGELSSVWLDHKHGHWGELEAQRAGAVTWAQFRGSWAEWRSSWGVSLEFLASFMLWAPASERCFAVQQMAMGKVLGDIWSSEWLSACLPSEELLGKGITTFEESSWGNRSRLPWMRDGYRTEGEMTGYAN